ncbi:unnamed protein product [Acanthoscelides obtectus]|uniref:Uncharacterized protein n=1 Tax=Acanthoscelides obtectus TaxID=200917 RepID=A0A9P0L8Z4_ACAOB|nr:unnamed protein product [Acanthoscelides obtectus]CAK1624635.1 hypothetical protein AOBTE_LOCUS2666 [Acanthoscelides obtectus]
MCSTTGVRERILPKKNYSKIKLVGVYHGIRFTYMFYA